MDRKITARLNMANAFKQVCDNNPVILKKVPAFESLVGGLGTKIAGLRTVIKSVSTNNSGLSIDKTNWKERLSLLASVVCGAGVAYARKVGDVVMEEKFAYTESALLGMRDTELIETAQTIIELQETVAAQLVEYGITTEVMVEVKAALENFEQKNTLPVVQIYSGEAKREEAMKLAFDLSDFVLQNMMKAALIYKITDLDFYQTLENASRISKVGVRHEEPKPIAADSDSGQQGSTAGKQAVLEQPSTSELLENMVRDIRPLENMEEVAANLLTPSQNGV